MIHATARVRTRNSSRYLVQLCKHFAHKVPARWDETGGEVDFPQGECKIQADGDILVISCMAESPDKLKHIQAIVEDHVTRFGWREKLAVTWFHAAEPE